MGFSSQSGQLIIKSQATPGTYDPDTGTDGVGIYFKGGTLEPSRELLTTDAEIGGGRDTPDALLGAVAFSGDIEFYARSAMLLTLLNGCLGTTVSPAVAGGFTTHTVTPVDSGTLPFFSLEEQVGGSFEVFQYADAIINTLHLEAEANGYLQGTAGLIARLQTAGNTATDPGDATFDSSPLFVGTNISVAYNGVSLPAKSFNLDISNNTEDDDFRLGSFYLGDLTAKRREITFGVSVRESSSALWRQAVYGTAAATAPGGLVTKSPMVLTISSYEDIPGAAPGVKYVTTITLPKLALEPYAEGPSGDDILESDVTGRALRPVLGTPAISVTVKTDTVVPF